MLDDWKIYLSRNSKFDIAKAYYNSHTKSSIAAFKVYACNVANSRSYKPNGATFYSLNNYCDDGCGFVFKCKCNSIVRLEFDFNTRRKNTIRVIYQGEHIGDTQDLVLYPNTFTYRGLFYLMQGFAEYMNEYYGNPLGMCLRSYLHRVGVKVHEIQEEG